MSEAEKPIEDQTVRELCASLRGARHVGEGAVLSFFPWFEKPTTVGLMVWKDAHSAENLVAMFLKTVRSLVEQGYLDPCDVEAIATGLKNKPPSV